MTDARLVVLHPSIEPVPEPQPPAFALAEPADLADAEIEAMRHMLLADPANKHALRKWADAAHD